MTLRHVSAVVVLAAGLGTAAAVAAPKDRAPVRRALPVPSCPAPAVPATKPSAALLSRFGVLREDREATDALPADVVEHLRRRGVSGFDPEAARLLRSGPNGARAWVVPVPDVRAGSAPFFGCAVPPPSVPQPPRGRGVRPAPAPAPRVPTAPAPAPLPAPRGTTPAVPVPVPVPVPRPATPAPRVPTPAPAPRATRPAVPPPGARAPAARVPTAPRATKPAVPPPAARAPRRSARPQPATVPSAPVAPLPAPVRPSAVPQPAPAPPPSLRGGAPVLVPPVLAGPGGQAVAPFDPLGPPLEGVLVVTRAGAADGGGGALEDLLKGRAAVSTEPCADGRADLVRLSGLVPDGVDRVFLTADDGSAVEARPDRNGYAFTVPVRAGAAEQRYVVWSGADGTPRVQPVVLTRLPKRLGCTIAASTARTVVVGPVGRPLRASRAGGRRAAGRRG